MGMARCQGKANGAPKQDDGRARKGAAMIIVTGQVRFADGEIKRLTPAFEMNIHATRAEAGCARYAYGVDVADPNLLHIVEEWSDEDAVNAHMNTPHMADLMTALASARIEAISINAYEAHFLKTLLGAG
jgi:quinol monooxygenase YgiN